MGNRNVRYKYRDHRPVGLARQESPLVSTERGLLHSAQHGRVLSHPHLPLESHQAPLDTRRRGLVAIADRSVVVGHGRLVRRA